MRGAELVPLLCCPACKLRCRLRMRMSTTYEVALSLLLNTSEYVVSRRTSTVVANFIPPTFSTASHGIPHGIPQYPTDFPRHPTDSQGYPTGSWARNIFTDRCWQIADLALIIPLLCSSPAHHTPKIREHFSFETLKIQINVDTISYHRHVQYPYRQPFSVGQHTYRERPRSEAGSAAMLLRILVPGILAVDGWQIVAGCPQPGPGPRASFTVSK